MFVITGNQRSGTTVLRQIVATSGFIDVGEITQAEFLYDNHRFYEFVRRKIQEDNKFIHPIEHAELFSNFLSELTKKYGKNITIDIKYNALRFLDFAILDEVPASVKILRKHGAKFVHINRMNKLRIIVSFQISSKNNIWGISGKDKPHLANIWVNPATIKKDIDDQDRWSRSISSMIPDSAHLIYEKMFNLDGNPSDYLLCEITRIFGVQIKLEGLKNQILKKQNEFHLNKMISNFSEIKDVLINTPYAWMLYD